MIQIKLAATDNVVTVEEDDWTICYDVVCDGYQPILTSQEDDVSVPIAFKTEDEAIKEMDDDPEFYEDCFPCKMSEIGHKIVFHGK